MIINKLTVNTVSIPPVLQKLSSPPKQLFHAGSPLAPLLERPRVAIVGSRNISPYGREVTYRLARQLADQGIVIVSGLAFGVDNIAHQATLEASG
ncbi:MAG TPA: DNA-processing protein DprA, partial [Verrucomicrobiae bacterium]|nr:DNA-processing protein DprA [Verrucomicrobiae bacterium]